MLPPVGMQPVDPPEILIAFQDDRQGDQSRVEAEKNTPILGPDSPIFTQ
jgi:hypothetical protein